MARPDDAVVQQICSKLPQVTESRAISSAVQGLSVVSISHLAALSAVLLRTLSIEKHHGRLLALSAIAAAGCAPAQPESTVLSCHASKTIADKASAVLWRGYVGAMAHTPQSSLHGQGSKMSCPLPTQRALRTLTQLVSLRPGCDPCDSGVSLLMPLRTCRSATSSLTLSVAAMA